MSVEKIVATISFCEQVGENEFIQRRFSRVFECDSSISDIFMWARSTGNNNLKINDIAFSNYCES